jgi:DNA-binding transcriptional ArsR family regulator
MLQPGYSQGLAFLLPLEGALVVPIVLRDAVSYTSTRLPREEPTSGEHPGRESSATQGQHRSLMDAHLPAWEFMQSRFLGTAMRVAGDPVRQSILELLHQRQHTVIELANRLPISRPAVSQHLRVLADAGLVRFAACGVSHVYTIEPQTLTALASYIARLGVESTYAFDESAVHRALAHPVRRRLVDTLARLPGRTTTQLAADIDNSRYVTIKHIKQLEAAKLVTTRRAGRNKHHYLDSRPLVYLFAHALRRYLDRGDQSTPPPHT